MLTSLIGVGLMVAAAIVGGRDPRRPARRRPPLSVGGAARQGGQTMSSPGVVLSFRVTRLPVAGSIVVCVVDTALRRRAMSTMPRMMTTRPARIRM